jgi:predicted membrane protein
MYSLLTDYKNMPPEAKNSIDWHSYTRFFRNVLFCFSALLFLGYLIRGYFQINYYLFAVYIVVIDFCAIFLIFWGKKKYTSKDTDTE